MVALLTCSKLEWRIFMGRPRTFHVLTGAMPVEDVHVSWTLNLLEAKDICSVSCYRSLGLAKVLVSVVMVCSSLETWNLVRGSTPNPMKGIAVVRDGSSGENYPPLHRWFRVGKKWTRVGKNIMAFYIYLKDEFSDDNFLFRKVEREEGWDGGVTILPW